MSHVLVHYAEYVHIRVDYYRVNNLKEMFDLVNPANIIGFFSAAGLFILI